MSMPPLLPEVILQRVLRLARFDGMSVLTIAGFFGLLAAAAGDYRGAIIGLLVAGTGAIELHGVTLLKAGYAEGMNWVIGSQFFMMAAMLGYCAFRLANVVIPPIPPNVATLVETTAAQLGWSTDEYLHFVYRLSFQMVGGLTVLYQGSMAIYYLRRRVAVGLALMNGAPGAAEE